MNKYLVKIPYSYTQYGTLTGYVYAEDEETAFEIAGNAQNVHESDYDDGDSYDTIFDYSETTVDLDEEDVEVPQDAHQGNDYDTHPPDIPIYYLAEVLLI